MLLRPLLVMNAVYVPAKRQRPCGMFIHAVKEPAVGCSSFLPGNCWLQFLDVESALLLR